MALEDALSFWNPRRVLDLLGEPEIERPAFSANAYTVLARRYLRRDEDGNLIETPGGMLRRVASTIAASERKYGADPARAEARFLDMMEQLEFLPNSPTLMNAGGELGNLAACFVLPVGDSLTQIFEAVKNTALIQQTGGGVGYSFSHLRPAGDPVATTHGVASGPVSFMDVFDSATETIKQGGRRRGALMAILSVDHPDVIEFVTAKSDLSRLRNFNLSVGLTDEFMRAVEKDGEYTLRNPRTRAETKRLRARKVFDLICNVAWASGEPGVLFADRIEAGNPTPHVGRLESTNPCAELPLLSYESCVLGSLNLARFVSHGEVDWERLGERARDAVRFLDDVIDASRYPLPEIETITRDNRKIGVGVMGWADMLVQLGIAYDSEEAVTLGDRVMAFVRRETRAASEALARERGPFPNFPGSALDRDGHPPLRNATTTTVAPTGTIGILAGCSGGIEPLFAVAFHRRILDGQELDEVHPLFRAVAAREGMLDDALERRVAKTGRVRGTPGVPERLANLFATAHDVSPEWHVRMQAVFQRHVDNSVSKTVNLPSTARPADVAEVYRLAYRLGCKGVTVYRDGSRPAQVLNLGAGEQAVARGLSSELCPDCREPLVKPDGCVYCRSCGWSRCG